MLRLRTFGGVSIERDGAPLGGAAAQRRPLALLAQLAAAGERGVSRAKLVGRLWAESDEEAARRVLAQTLYSLRRAVGADAVLGTTTLRLNSDVIAADVAEFADALARGDPERAVGLYAGPFLDGFYVPDAPEFERWAEDERDRLRGEYAGALEALASSAAERAEAQTEAEWWRKRAGVDPLDARVAVRLMRALAAAGDRTAALRHARVYEALVREQFGVPPDDAVLALASQLRDAPSLPAAPAAPALTLAPAAAPAPAPAAAPAAATESAGGPVAPAPMVASPAAPAPDDQAVSRPRRSEPWRLGDGGAARGAGAARHLPVGKRARLAASAAGLALALAAAAYLARQHLWARQDAERSRTTLAVLPFRNLTPAPELEFLGVGIPDAIITRLANVHQLRVRPTSAILGYEDRTVGARQAGRDLAAEYLVSGTVQDVAGQFRVSVQLVRASDEAPLWGKSYDLPRADLLTLQDEVARRVSTALRVQMSEAERARVYRRYTQNAAAYELYLRGRADLARHTEPATRAAVAAFERALQSDDRNALAHAGLAMASAELHLRFASGAEVNRWGQRAEQEARRAMQLDSTVAESHQALATVYRKSDFDWERTIAESRRALELSPSLELPHYYIAAAFYHLGLLDLAEREALAAADANPVGDRAELLRTRGIVALLQGRYADAVALLESLRRISDRALSDTYLAQAYFYAGDTARAEAMLDELARSGSAAPVARSRATLASLLAARGERTRARPLLRAIDDAGYIDHHVAYSVGAAYAQLGDKPRAREWLARASTLGFPCYPWFARDPLLQPMRDDPAFQGMLREQREASAAAAARYRE